MTSSRLITGLTLTAAAAALTVGFAAPANAAGTLSANKTTGLAAAGETIKVTGSGFEPGKSLTLINCVLTTQRGEGCDMAATAPVQTDAQGAFTADFGVKGTFGTTDCTKVECGVVVYDMATHSLPARLKLSYAGAAAGNGSAAPSSAAPGTSAPGTSAPSGTTAPTDKPQLPKTGGSDSTLPLVAGGTALVLVGAGATFAVRRRGGSNHAA